ncbi:MAG: M56 family metallopeptidase [Planctomycetota bacterium]
MTFFMESDRIVFSIVVCVVQVTVLAILGTIATRWLLPRRPQVAATVATAVLSAILLLTVAVPCSVPRWLFSANAADRVEPPEMETRGLREPAITSVRGLASGRHHHAGSTFDLRQIVARIGSKIQPRNDEQGRYATATFAVLLSISTLAGLVHFVIGIVSTAALLRQCKRLVSGRAADSMLEIVEFSGTYPAPELLETTQHSSAAVVGLFRPKVLLPAEWRAWSDVELQCVLAHELAHVQSRDFAWRILGALACSMHFWNPAVHLLLRSMVLAQELTADMSAASVMDRGVYVKSLSNLALRRDRLGATWDRFGIAPVFSGYLIRRIKMLNQWKHVGLKPTSTRLRIAAFMSVVICGVGAIALRGYAEPPDTIAGESTEAADAPVTRMARVAKPNHEGDDRRRLFHREGVRAADMPTNRTGMFSVQLGEVLRYPGFEQLVSFANTGLATGMKDGLELDSMLPVDLRSIEAIYGSAHVGLRPREDEGESSLFLGSGLLFVQSQQEVDAEAWTQEHVSRSAVKEVDAGSYVEIAHVPLLGPAPILIADRDAKTFGIGTRFRPSDGDPEQEEQERATRFMAGVRHRVQDNASSWAGLFDQVGGGLLTLAFTSEDFQHAKNLPPDETLTDTERVARQSLHRIQSSLEAAAIGLDVSDDGTLLGLNARIATDDRARQEIVAQDIRELIGLGKRLLDQPMDHADREVKDPAMGAFLTCICRQFLDRMVVTEIHGAGMAHTVAIQTTVEHPELVGRITAYMLSDMFVR